MILYSISSTLKTLKSQNGFLISDQFVSGSQRNFLPNEIRQLNDAQKPYKMAPIGHKKYAGDSNVGEARNPSPPPPPQRGGGGVVKKGLPMKCILNIKYSNNISLNNHIYIVTPIVDWLGLVKGRVSRDFF